MTRLRRHRRAAAFLVAVGAAGCRSAPVPLTNAPPGTPGAVAVAYRFAEPRPLDELRPSGSGRANRSLTVAARTENPILQVAAASPAVQPGPALPAPPTVPADAELPIDLGSAVRLAGAENPTIGLARERIREAVAVQLAARSLLLPDLNTGANIHVHRGNLQRSAGGILNVNSQNFYAGSGVNALVANPTTIPGVWLLAHLGDAAFEPLAARQQVAVRSADARAVNNAVLLDAVRAYLDLFEAEARAASLRQSEADLGEIVRLTAAYAKAGEGRVGDANRAAANADLFRRRVQQADEDAATAAARLSGLLNLDPTARLRTPGGPAVPVPLIDENRDLEELVQDAQRGRPEMAARAAAVAEAQVRVRQERVRPWLPTLSVGFSAGQFGGGSNRTASDFSPAGSRTDFDAVAVWTAENVGVGNRSRVRAASAIVGQAVADLERVRNRVRDEVAAAKADAQAAAEQYRVATAALPIAEEGYRLELQRIKEGEGLPLEVLDSFKQLADARIEAIRAAVAYTAAQFRLIVALGNPPPESDVGPPVAVPLTP